MLLFAAAVLIGSQACRPCHASIFDSYVRTPMARSSGRVESLPPATFTAAGHRYQIRDQRLLFEGGSASIDYFIGSNSAGRTFVRERDGFLFQLPITWYAERKIWDAAPGYERDSEIRLTRPIEPSCLLCHSSRVRPVLGTQNRYGDPPFGENGVACERCHGPGSEHAQNPTTVSMAHPGRLDAERRDAICSQCHLSGEARIERPGRKFVEFRAGERLADYVTYFVRASDNPAVKATSHVQKLAMSQCKVASGDKLWCGTCHDPHTNDPGQARSACLGCHAAVFAGKASGRKVHREKDDCVACHMPRARAVDANHGVMTDHSIPRVPRTDISPAPDTLTAFLGTADDRSLGLAYAELGSPRAREYLLRATPQDWPVRLRLAVLEADPARAIRLYESVLRDEPYVPAALVNLGSLYAKQGRIEEAGRLWERALSGNPAIEEAIVNLAQIRSAEESRVLLQRYLEVHPTSRAARRLLILIDEGTRTGPKSPIP